MQSIDSTDRRWSAPQVALSYLPTRCMSLGRAADGDWLQSGKFNWFRGSLFYRR